MCQESSRIFTLILLLNIYRAVVPYKETFKHSIAIKWKKSYFIETNGGFYFQAMRRFLVLFIILFLKIKIEGNSSIHVCILIALIPNKDWLA